MDTHGYNILSIWQEVRSECGYCKGSFAHVLSRGNSIPAFSGEPEVEIFHVVSRLMPNADSDDDDDDDDDDENDEKGDTIDESTCSNSYACNFEVLSPLSYQLLIDRGWRRSGKLLYRPKNHSSCCPCYPIRLDTHLFQISKSQKKVLKTLSSALVDVKEDLQQKGKRRHHETNMQPNNYHNLVLQRLVQECSLRSILKEALHDQLKDKYSDVSGICDWKVRKVYKVKRHKDSITCDAIVSSSIVPRLCGQWKEQINKIELANEIKTMLQKDSKIQNYKHDHIGPNGRTLWNVSVQEIQVHEKSLQINVVTQMTVHNEYFHQTSYEPLKKEKRDTTKKHILDLLQEAKVKNIDKLKPPYTLTVRTIPSHNNEHIHDVHELYCKYQHAVHGDDDPFTITKKNDVDSKEVDSGSTHAESEDSGLDKHALKLCDFEKKYSNLEKDQIRKIYKSYCSFHRFLCSSPIVSESPDITNDVPAHSDATWNDSSQTRLPFHISQSDVSVPYGTYHQYYLINDVVLIAVGVVDILPHCLSSVYSMYDPVLSEYLNLGKLTALYEIEWVKHATRLRPDLKYYYLGYYIHSCQKMKYKAEYKPSELNCPVRGKWVNFDVAIRRLNLRSPIRHCCNISTPDVAQENEMDYEYDSSQRKQEDDAVYSFRNVLFDIGYGNLLTIDKLTPQGVKLLQPILETFVAEAGPEVASKSIIKFR